MLATEVLASAPRAVTTPPSAAPTRGAALQASPPLASRAPLASSQRPAPAAGPQQTPAGHTMLEQSSDTDNWRKCKGISQATSTPKSTSKKKLPTVAGEPCPYFVKTAARHSCCRKVGCSSENNGHERAKKKRRTEFAERDITSASYTSLKAQHFPAGSAPAAAVTAELQRRKQWSGSTDRIRSALDECRQMFRTRNPPNLTQSPTVYIQPPPQAHSLQGTPMLAIMQRMLKLTVPHEAALRQGATDAAYTSPHERGAVIVVPKTAAVTKTTDTSLTKLSQKAGAEGLAPLESLKCKMAAEILHAQQLIRACVREHSALLQLRDAEQVEELLALLFRQEFTPSEFDQQSLHPTDRKAVTRAKVIDSFPNMTWPAEEEPAAAAPAAAAPAAAAAVPAKPPKRGNSVSHQDYMTIRSLVLALSISDADAGNIVYSKLRPEYLCASDSKAADRHTHVVEELKYQCGGPHGSAMSMTPSENDGWMHGTDLLSTCKMRLMYQQTMYVHFGKQDVVMKILRKHLLGPQLQARS